MKQSRLSQNQLIGGKKNLPSSATEGTTYFCLDTEELYLFNEGGVPKLISSSNQDRLINGLRTDLNTNTSNITDLENSKLNSTTSGEPAGADKALNIVTLTQAEYDAGTPLPTTIYIIKDS